MKCLVYFKYMVMVPKGVILSVDVLLTTFSYTGIRLRGAYYVCTYVYVLLSITTFTLIATYISDKWKM